MATTNDEKSREQLEQEKSVATRGVAKKDVIAEYILGKNYYQLAEEFFGFQSDEAVERIRVIVEEEIKGN